MSTQKPSPTEVASAAGSVRRRLRPRPVYRSPRGFTITIRSHNAHSTRSWPSLAAALAHARLRKPGHPQTPPEAHYTRCTAHPRYRSGTGHRHMHAFGALLLTVAHLGVTADHVRQRPPRSPEHGQMCATTTGRHSSSRECTLLPSVRPSVRIPGPTGMNAIPRRSVRSCVVDAARGHTASSRLSSPRPRGRRAIDSFAVGDSSGGVAGCFGSAKGSGIYIPRRTHSPTLQGRGPRGHYRRAVCCSGGSAVPAIARRVRLQHSPGSYPARRLLCSGDPLHALSSEYLHHIYYHSWRRRASEDLRRR